jgi:hypothetical protein
MRSLFSIISGAECIPVYNAIWYSLTNDRSQRRALKAAARTSYEIGELSKAVFDKISWMLGQADAVAEVRNDAVHAPLVAAAGQVSPAATWGHPRATRLLNKPLLDEFRWCRDASLTLTDFCMRIDMALNYPRDHALPNTPHLPARGKARKSVAS